MKKTLKLLLLFLLVIPFVSCSSDDKDNDVTEDDSYQTLILGTWRMDDKGSGYITYTFSKGGKCIYREVDNREEYSEQQTYEIKGEKLYISGYDGPDNPYTDIFTIVTLNSKKMTLYFEGYYLDGEFIEENPGMEYYYRVD